MLGRPKSMAYRWQPSLATQFQVPTPTAPLQMRQRRRDLHIDRAGVQAKICLHRRAGVGPRSLAYHQQSSPAARTRAPPAQLLACLSGPLSGLKLAWTNRLASGGDVPTQTGWRWAGQRAWHINGNPAQLPLQWGWHLGETCLYQCGPHLGQCWAGQKAWHIASDPARWLVSDIPV